MPLKESISLSDLPPIWRRGVSIKWLDKFANIYEDMRLITKDIVNLTIIPSTNSQQIPLWARIPAQYRGNPNHFISHAWDDTFKERFGFGIMSVLLNSSMSEEDFFWIDIISHNQHKPEQLPPSLGKIVQKIGSILFLIDRPILLTRSWCIFELIEGYRNAVPIEIKIAGGSLEDHYRNLRNTIK